MANDHPDLSSSPSQLRASSPVRRAETLRPARLFTSFGTELYADRSTGELRHGPIGSVPSDVSLVAVDGFGPGRNFGRLVCEVDGTTRQFIYGFDRCIVDGPDAGKDGVATAHLLKVIAIEGGLFALSADDKFLMAEPEGQVRLCAPA